MPYKRSYRKYRKTSRRGRLGRGRRTYRLMKKAASRVLMKKTETKNTTIAVENQGLYHNYQQTATNGQPTSDGVFWNCWATSIVAGTRYDQRIGNEIYPRGMSIRMYLENIADRPNIHYRVIIGVAPKTRTDGTAMTFNALELMQGVGSNIIRHVNTEYGYKILYDRVFRNEVGISNTGAEQGNHSGYMKRCHLFKKIWIRRKRGGKIRFTSSVAGVPAPIDNKPVFMMVIPYDSYNTLATDLCGVLNYQAKLYWKDV